MTEFFHSAAVPKPIRIFIVDDHAWIRLALTALLRADGGFTVCGEAEGAARALTILDEIRPDIAIVDISLRGGMDGLELTGALKRQQPDLAVLILSMHAELQYATRALAAGASGYVTKGEAPEVLVSALRSIMGGATYLSPEMKESAAKNALEEAKLALGPRGED